jgi:hypothetical protein
MSAYKMYYKFYRYFKLKCYLPFRGMKNSETQESEEQQAKVNIEGEVTDILLWAILISWM